MTVTGDIKQALEILVSHNEPTDFADYQRWLVKRLDSEKRRWANSRRRIGRPGRERAALSSKSRKSSPWPSSGKPISWPDGFLSKDRPPGSSRSRDATPLPRQPPSVHQMMLGLERDGLIRRQPAPEASTSSSRLKTCQSSSGSTSTRQNLCDEPLDTDGLLRPPAFTPLQGHIENVGSIGCNLGRRSCLWPSDALAWLRDVTYKNR